MYGSTYVHIGKSIIKQRGPLAHAQHNGNRQKKKRHKTKRREERRNLDKKKPKQEALPPNKIKYLKNKYLNTF